MPNGYVSKNEMDVKVGSNVVATDELARFGLTAGGSVQLRIDIAAGTPPTCRLDTSPDGGTTWVQGPTSLADGSLQTIAVSPGDAGTPLRNLARVVATGAGTNMTAVYVMQEL